MRELNWWGTGNVKICEARMGKQAADRCGRSARRRSHCWSREVFQNQRLAKEGAPSRESKEQYEDLCQGIMACMRDGWECCFVPIVAGTKSMKEEVWNDAMEKFGVAKMKWWGGHTLPSSLLNLSPLPPSLPPSLPP